MDNKFRSISDLVVDKEGWDMLQELDKSGQGLTQWEIDYVESITKWLLSRKYLTDKQREKLTAIYDERVNNIQPGDHTDIDF